MAGVNPIKDVGGYSVRAPDAEDGYLWEEEDVSKNGGRTEDVKMQKNRIGQVQSLSLKWSGLTTSEASTILKAFDKEYVYITYLDPKVGGFITREFYTGNRRGTLYNYALNKWSEISFKIVAREGK